MIGYITKVSFFGALARYLQAGTDGPSDRRVLWTDSRYVSDDLQKAAAEMSLTSHLTDTDSLGYHLTIGYDPTDRPTRAEMEYAVERTLSALGLEDNMAITAAHGDAYFAHTHTMIARWDYWTARLVEASNSYYVITGVMRELEEELGMEPAPRPYWERAEREKEGGQRESSPTLLADRFSTAVRNKARSALQTATSWGHLQELLRKQDLRFVRGRDNLLIAKGEEALRAGQITGGTSLAKLEARFGQTLREHEAEVAGRLMGAAGDAPRKAGRQEKVRAQYKTREDTRTDRNPRSDEDSRSGRERETSERRAEDILLLLAKAFRRREEAYQLTRRSALLEAEEADAAGLQEDLQQVETRGRALLEELRQTGAPSSRKRFSNGATRRSEIEETRRLRGQALELWRAVAQKVERRESTRSITAEGLQGELGEEVGGKTSPEEEKRLCALLEEHRLAARKAWELFGKEVFAKESWRARTGGSAEVETQLETERPGGASSLNADSRSARRFLRETRESIREAQAKIEGRLSEMQEQAREGRGPARLERRLRQVLGRLAEDNPEAVSRFVRRYVGEDGEDSGIEGNTVLQGEALKSRPVQEALRRALPEGHRIESEIEERGASRPR